MKLFLIRLADWFDDNVLRHRWMWICERLYDSSWWGAD